jgi:hypothetical protein
MGAKAGTGFVLALGSAAFVLACLAAGATATSLLAQDPAQYPARSDELVARGRFLYRVYCTNCHGQGGRGDGVSAGMLKITPADLTRLSRDNPNQQGEFPFERVYRTIDGREEVRGHGSRRMPIWGLNLQELDRDVDQEDEVRGKILQLIEYLKSIQQPGDSDRSGKPYRPDRRR